MIDFLNARPPTADRDHRNDRHADNVGVRRPDSRRGFRAERPRGHSRDRADELIHVRAPCAQGSIDRGSFHSLPLRVPRYARRAHAASDHDRDNQRDPHAERRCGRSLGRGRGKLCQQVDWWRTLVWVSLGSLQIAAILEFEEATLNQAPSSEYRPAAICGDCRFKPDRPTRLRLNLYCRASSSLRNNEKRPQWPKSAGPRH